MADRDYLVQLTKKLADEGKLIEAGWVAVRLACIPDNASAAQLQEMRLAYMAGAQHVFSSMINMLDDDKEPTEADMEKMTLIHKELEDFRAEVELWAAKAKGRG